MRSPTTPGRLDPHGGNHRYAIYEKLGISGRPNLAELLSADRD